MAATELKVDVGEVKVGSHLHDGDQDRAATVGALLEVVGDMPSRLLPGTGHDAAVVSFAEGLRDLADVLDPE